VLIDFSRSVPSFVDENNYEALYKKLDEVKHITRGIFSLGLERESDKGNNIYYDQAKKVDELEELALKSKFFLARVEEIYEKINSLHVDSNKKGTSLTEEMFSVRASVHEINENRDRVEKASQSINSLLEQVLAASKKISELKSDSEQPALELIESHNEIRELKNHVKKYHIEMVEWSKQRENAQSEALGLIENAKKALGYTTASSLSDAFKLQYKISNKSVVTQRWLNYAVLFFVLSFLIGVWALYKSDTLTIEIILSRFLLMPLTIAAAWFCSSQFVKQKNIAEDYAYKTVLAKSIVGFSEQLSKKSNQGDEYKKYIEKMLDEIHRDPIRRNERRNVKGAELDELIKKVNEIKPTLDKVIESVTKSK
jgi:uncharacterized coiled-coil DUF342 family protein